MRGHLDAFDVETGEHQWRCYTVPKPGEPGSETWPEEGEAYLVAIRLADGAIIERAKVTLPALKQNRISQGTGDGHFLLGRQGVPNEAPRAAFSYME